MKKGSKDVILFSDDDNDDNEPTIDDAIGNDEVVKIVDNAIYFAGDIDTKSSHQFALALRRQEKAKKPFVDKTQKVFLTSPGGLVYSSLEMYDLIKKSSLEINIVIQGLVASGGSIMACGAKKISMYENSYLMLHELAGGIIARFHQNEVEMNLQGNMMDKIIRIYKERTGNASIDRQWLMIDKYFTAKEAYDFKLVDEVL